MSGILLDTHTLYWLASGEEVLSEDAFVAIGQNQEAGTLYVSPITAWELSIAARKPPHKDRPALSSPVPRWFGAALRATSARVAPIGRRIAIEAADVPVATGHKDPGDCFLVATSRVRKIPIVTRDTILRRMAEGGYLSVIVC